MNRLPPKTAQGYITPFDEVYEQPPDQYAAMARLGTRRNLQYILRMSSRLWEKPRTRIKWPWNIGVSTGKLWMMAESTTEY